MKQLRTLFTSFFLSLSLFAVALTPLMTPVAHAQTQAWNQPCIKEFNLPKGNAGQTTQNNHSDKVQVATIQGLQCALGNILSIAISGIGLAGFAMLLVGAFRYMLSGGNAKGVEGGRNTMTFAIVGLVVALSAFMLLRIVASFTGVQTILEFRVPTSDDRPVTPRVPN